MIDDDEQHQTSDEQLTINKISQDYNNNNNNEEENEYIIAATTNNGEDEDEDGDEDEDEDEIENNHKKIKKEENTNGVGLINHQLNEKVRELWINRERTRERENVKN